MRRGVQGPVIATIEAKDLLVGPLAKETAFSGPVEPFRDVEKEVRDQTNVEYIGDVAMLKDLPNDFH